MAHTKIPKGTAKVFSAMHRSIYKLSGGRVGGSFGESKVILVTTTGRKSGKKRTLPLIGVDHGDGWGVIASASGHDWHPAWYLNLEANPDATVTVGRTVHSVVARMLEGEERQQVWDQAVEVYPAYAEYQNVTDRVIPVVTLTRRTGGTPPSDGTVSAEASDGNETIGRQQVADKALSDITQDR